MAQVYGPIIDDEIDHKHILEDALTRKQGKRVLRPYFADSPEYLSSTIAIDGWQDKISQAFTNRINNIKG